MIGVFLVLGIGSVALWLQKQQEIGWGEKYGKEALEYADGY